MRSRVASSMRNVGPLTVTALSFIAAFAIVALLTSAVRAGRTARPRTEMVRLPVALTPPPTPIPPPPRLAAPQLHPGARSESWLSLSLPAPDADAGAEPASLVGSVDSWRTVLARLLQPDGPGALAAQMTAALLREGSTDAAALAAAVKNSQRQDAVGLRLPLRPSRCNTHSLANDTWAAVSLRFDHKETLKLRTWIEAMGGVMPRARYQGEESAEMQEGGQAQHRRGGRVPVRLYEKTRRPADFTAPNIGREEVPYLAYIVDHYECLPAYSAFLHADAAAHNPALLQHLRCLRHDAHAGAMTEAGLPWLPLTTLRITDRPVAFASRIFAALHEASVRLGGPPLFPSSAVAPQPARGGGGKALRRGSTADNARLNLDQFGHMYGYCCAEFVLPRETIQRWPRAFWEAAYWIAIDTALEGELLPPAQPDAKMHQQRQQLPQEKQEKQKQARAGGTVGADVSAADGTASSPQPQGMAEAAGLHRGVPPRKPSHVAAVFEHIWGALFEGTLHQRTLTAGDYCTVFRSNCPGSPCDIAPGLEYANDVLAPPEPSQSPAPVYPDSNAGA